MNDVSLLWLFCTFFYIGLFTIGGGVVAITLMQQTIVEKALISSEQFYNMVAISESTPGPLGVNMATYIGYNLYGISGGIITSLGEVLPSIIIILIIARFLKSFHENFYVKTVLSLMRPVSTGVILMPVVNIFILALMNLPGSPADFAVLDTWKNLFNWSSLAAYAIFTFVLFKFKMHPVFIIIAGAVFGIFFL